MDPSESSQSALEVPSLLISCISFFAFFTVFFFFPFHQLYSAEVLREYSRGQQHGDSCHSAPVNDRRFGSYLPLLARLFFYVDRGRRRLGKREVIHTATGDHSNYQHIEEGEKKRRNVTRSSKWAVWQRLKAWKAAHMFPGSHINSLITQTRLASAAQHPEWAGSAQNRFANKQTIKRK